MHAWLLLTAFIAGGVFDDRNPRKVETLTCTSQLEGTWEVVAYKSQKFENDPFPARWHFGQKQVAFDVPANSHGIPIVMYYKVRPEATKEIDFQIAVGDFSCPVPLSGIFRLSGDTLTICANYKQRPTTFEASEDNSIWIFKRVPWSPHPTSLNSARSATSRPAHATTVHAHSRPNFSPALQLNNCR